MYVRMYEELSGFMFRIVVAGYDYIDCLGRCLSPSHC